MDYNGRWKALQYTVRSSFQDVLLSIDGTDREKVDVHVVSDLRTAVSAELVLTLYQFNGSVLREWAHPVELGADSAAIVFSSPVAELLEGQGVGDVLLGIGLQADGKGDRSQAALFYSGKRNSIAALSNYRAGNSREQWIKLHRDQ